MVVLERTGFFDKKEMVASRFNQAPALNVLPQVIIAVRKYLYYIISRGKTCRCPY
jgi:hypothetical protein